MAFHSHTLRAGLLAFVMGLIGSGANAGSIDLYGVTEATLTWQAASGPVVGYYVVIFRDDQPPSVETFSTVPSATITASEGEAVTLRVAAFSADGIAGPISEPSDTIRFNPAQGESDPPPPAPDDGGAGDPPPDDGGAPAPDGSGSPLDFTGDGISDLLLRQSTGEIALWRMDGSSVTSSQPFPYLPPSWQIVGNGDYDGNDVADLLWEESGTGRLIVWLVADGMPDSGALLDQAGLQSEHEWAVGGSGDFDGDGSDDVLLFSRVLGEAEILYLHDGAVEARERLTGYSGAWSVAATDDFDGDGSDEILWRDERGHALVAWNPDESDVKPYAVSDSVLPWRVVASGDFDGDGTSDVFARHRDTHQMQVWRFEAGVLADAIELPDAPDDEWVARGTGDFDLDGRADLVWFDAVEERIEIWFSDATDVTAELVIAPKGSALGMLASGQDGSDDAEFLLNLCDGDFDGDGVVTLKDLPLLPQCFGQAATGVCAAADMDSDARVTEVDYELFQRVFGEPSCRE